ncbi:transposase [Vibrio metschnikovii]|uniref:Transposase n=1 Tax=Vibrio metschnikovii TaxID=28172 RepID=A0A9X0RAD7_VIBME|nr:transposase [Vibrio metschnikovii]
MSFSLSGFDLGLTDFLISDKGEKIANPRFLINAYKNLRRKQKALSRCKKGSKNRAKARLLLAKAHECVANARNECCL